MDYLLILVRVQSIIGVSWVYCILHIIAILDCISLQVQVDVFGLKMLNVGK